MQLQSTPIKAPLADRMRPRTWQKVIGQAHLLGKDQPLARLLNQGQLYSMVLWGPPGCGKTTLSYLLAQGARANIESLSAVHAGVKDIKAVVERAQYRQGQGTQTVLFVDEVHRFNKSQQDAFLPHIENGTLIFIGATTENPSFELNRALLSRVQVHTLNLLTTDDLDRILESALTDSVVGLGLTSTKLSDTAKHALVESAGGDARRLLNWLEALCSTHNSLDTSTIEIDSVKQLIRLPIAQFDKQGELFYDTISALHKSIRGSNPDAALYWLARMLVGGCDGLYIARRLIRMASEDIGNADPRALTLTLQAWDVLERLGPTEGEIVLAQAVIYLACAAKSNAVYKAYQSAMAFAKKHPDKPIPIHLRNAPTSLMKKMGYGKHYRYTHDEPHAYVPNEQYFPDEASASFYQPSDRGLEKKILQKLEHLKQLDLTDQLKHTSKQ